MKKVDPEPVWYRNKGRPRPWDAALRNTDAGCTVSMPMPGYTIEKESLKALTDHLVGGRE